MNIASTTDNSEKEDRHKAVERIKAALLELTGQDLSGVKAHFWKNPAVFSNGRRVTKKRWAEATGDEDAVSMPDAENSTGSATEDEIFINSDMSRVMRHWGIPGADDPEKVREFRNRAGIGHELAHIADAGMERNNPMLRKTILDKIRASGFHTVYSDTHKGSDATSRAKHAKELIAEWLAMMASKKAEKKAEDTPSDAELRRMYNLLQEDAKLDRRVNGLGFGRNGDAYRRAALKLRIMSLMKVLRDGKGIRNRIVHEPGYIPSEADVSRAMGQYAEAGSELDSLKLR